MAHLPVRGFSPAVLKWLIPVLQSRCTTTRTGRILDLPANRGYRAKEMLSSHTFAASGDRALPATKIAYGEFGHSRAADFSARCSFDADAPANERRARS